MATGMNVLMISPYPLEPGKVNGGIEAVVSALVPALAQQDRVNQVTVLCLHHGETVSRHEQVNEKLQIRYVRGQSKLRLLSRSFLDVLHARQAMRELGIHVVHGQGIGRRGDTAIQLTSAPVITVHGLVHREAVLAGSSLRDRVRSSFVAATVKRVLERAKVVISISDYDAKALQGLVRGQRLSIPNPIAADFFQDAPTTNNQYVLFAGVLLPRKNVAGLLNGFAIVRSRVPSARLLMLGPAPDSGYARVIHEQVAQLKLGDAIEFAGHVENDRLVSELRSCGMVALFSREETAPTILAQAMALGKPVVASRVGGIPEMVVDGKSGFLVDSGDEQALADRLITLIKSPDLRLQMGAHGRDFAHQRYEPFAVARRTVDAYQLALNPSLASVNTHKVSNV